MAEHRNQPGPTPGRSSRTRIIINILIIGILILAIFYFAGQPSSKKQITYGEFVEQLEAGAYKNVDVYGTTIKIQLKDSKISDKDFPKKYDKYTSHTSYEKLEEKLVTYQAANPDFKFDMQIAEQSFLDIILPYLIFGIVAAILLTFVMRGLNKSQNSALSFGRSRARVIAQTKITFKDVAGSEEEKQELAEIVEFLKNPEKFIAVGARIPKGFLLVGPPGTGKTLLAKAVAGESNVPFYSITGSDFVEMFVGVGASRVRDLFEQAKHTTPCIIFIDEIDAVGRQRGAGMGGGNDEREQTLNQLLVQMDGFESNSGIIVMAATNRADVLDPALLRPGRFDRQIYVYPPDVKGRELILEVHAKGKPLSEDIKFKDLSRLTTGFTGADIELLLNEAAILAARANRAKITMTDLTEAVNKVIIGPQKKSRIVTPKDKRITAFHEAGHAIVGKKLLPDDAIAEVSIIPRGGAAGYTLSRPETDDNHITLQKLKNEIAMTMGGRAAEILTIKDITTGASGDIQSVTKMARHMVCEWGMSKLGPINYGSSSELLLGRDYQVRNTYSDKIAADIDDEVHSIVDEGLKTALKILQDNKKILDHMAELLLERETIYSEEIDLLMAGKTVKEVLEVLEKRDEANRKRAEAEKKEMEEKRADMERSRKEKHAMEAAEFLRQAGIITFSEETVKKEEPKQEEKTTSEKTAVEQAEEQLNKNISKKEKTGKEKKDETDGK